MVKWVKRADCILTALLSASFLLTSGCSLNMEGEYRGDSGGERDVPGDSDGGSELRLDVRSDGDIPAPDGYEAELDDPPLPEAETSSDDVMSDPVLEDPVVEENPPAPFCGDGRVDIGEECDDTSTLCAGCVLTPPDGWTRCTDSAGRIFFWFIEDWAGVHSWQAMRDQCLSIIQGLSPQNASIYGLAVFSDRAIWDCISPYLDTGKQYYIGLSQRSDGTEPDGGWVWTVYDGAGWAELGPLDCATSPFVCIMDDGCGVGDVDCGRIMFDTTAVWSFWDYGCASEEDWDGICMILFEQP